MRNQDIIISELEALLHRLEELDARAERLKNRERKFANHLFPSKRHDLLVQINKQQLEILGEMRILAREYYESVI